MQAWKKGSLVSIAKFCDSIQASGNQQWGLMSCHEWLVLPMCRVDELQRQEAEIRVAMEAAGNDKHKVNSHMMVAP